MQEQADVSGGYTPKIAIPDELVHFFKPREIYIPPHRGRSGKALEFKDISGEDPREIPPEFYQPNDRGILREEYLLENRTKRGQQTAERQVVKALEYLLGKRSYEDISRHYMINTGTVPIKIKWREGGKRVSDEVYIKVPDTNRIMGNYLYNIISGFPPQKWAFNEYIHVEEGIKGNPLSRLDESILLADESYWAGLARAAVHADFLAIGEDVENPRNRIVTHDRETVLFDFDLLFCGWRGPNTKPILSKYARDHGRLTPATLEAYYDERFEVVRRIQYQEDEFFKFVAMIGKLVDRTTFTLNTKISKSYPFDNIESYFDERLDEFSK